MDEAKIGVGVATLLAGATPFNAGNVNETYRGQIQLAGGEIALAIVKDLSIRQLTNELLASTLAHAVGLPTPRAYLTVARPSVISLNQAPQMPDGNRLVFASVDAKTPSLAFRYEQNPSLAPSLLAALTAWEDLGRCYGFDSWTANTDRHPGNLLFGGPKDVWLIDHGHAFTGPMWQVGDLRPTGGYDHRMGQWLTPHMGVDDRKAKAGEAAGFEALISGVDVEELIQASMVDKLLPSAEIDELRNFLRDRRPYVSYYSNQALDFRSLV
ncbi:HipA family kinase [Novosphingobium sp. ST904]|uniref:HipA family kinase n=1 Tax=Novosphingobium sp. ST904 TaxID=1684385 RepID=UPI00104DA20A|nr:HipA family kinase [Novosphingobium sp. ST904]